MRKLILADDIGQETIGGEETNGNANKLNVQHCSR